MARHKHKNPRVKVFFRYRGRCFRLLEAINFGTKTAPELKIKGLAETYMQTKDDQHRFDGHFHVGQLIRFIDGKNVEFTYHKDGSILSEVVMSPGHKEYFNPYGKNEKWTPLSEIDSYQPVMVLQIFSLADYRPAFIENKYGQKNYIVKNEKMNKSFVVPEGTKEAKLARLSYRVVGKSDTFYLLEVELFTGRHHQIRCQLAHMGCPIRGDLKYGYPRSNPDASISLHAWRIAFEHPVTKQQIEVTAPLPEAAPWTAFQQLSD